MIYDIKHHTYIYTSDIHHADIEALLIPIIRVTLSVHKYVYMYSVYMYVGIFQIKR